MTGTLQRLRHIAIIMDGNGRWANVRSRPRVWGHVRGSSVVSEIVEEADSLGISALTLYAFSTENWCRPPAEVKVLFALLKKFLLKEKPRIIKNKIRFRIMGDITNLPKDTQKLIRDLEVMSEKFQGLKLTFAFGYGGRNEIVDAWNHWIKNHPGEPLNLEQMQNSLYVSDTGDVDLLIRTGGDFRVSNFMLWQIAYAELFFTNTKWPEFTRDEFREIVKATLERERRFGSVISEVQLSDTMKKAEENKLQMTLHKDLYSNNGQLCH